MIFILIIGILAVLFGFLFIFAPRLVQKLNEFGNTIITTDDKTILYRHTTGVLFIIIGLIMFYLVLH